MRAFQFVIKLTVIVLWGLLCGSTLFAQEKPAAPKKPKNDLAIPIPKPKPLVWREDWPGVPELPAARKKATELLQHADDQKSEGEFAEAEKSYLACIEADPTWATPHYQLACNYELSGQSDKASASFDEALKLGYDDFPTAITDDELGTIRKRPSFKQNMLDLKQRFIATSATRIGQPIGIRPKGTPPAGGWPLILLFHGYGDTNVSFLPEAEKWAEQGFVAVAIPGSIPIGVSGYRWSNDSSSTTHRDAQSVLQSPLLAEIVNQERVYLLGFSQGAQHALLLIMKKPENYAGVVAISPGGSLMTQILLPSLKEKRSCVFIFGNQEPLAPVASRWKTACKKAEWKFMGKVHPGGHQFPEHWDALLPEVVKFLSTDQ